jgi:hypothetical protein
MRLAVRSCSASVGSGLELFEIPARTVTADDDACRPDSSNTQ